MKYVPSVALLRALRGSGSASISQSSRCLRAIPSGCARKLQTSTSATTEPAIIPLRKQIKDEARARKSGPKLSPHKGKDARLKDWELTVGIEIHAELNTSAKLFSFAQTSIADSPNSHVSIFDAAEPGAQPQFQQETLLPALRAALALGCEIQPESSWDRKHYFWWDQPNGYQITQYYQPFAKNGSITLYPHDDIDPVDGGSVQVGIKQIQMEQDTAKTILQPPTNHLLDFNRVSHPLIEIITLPQIHSPKTASALVRKIQAVLTAVGANTTGMELGGLRADVNVSVRRRDSAPGGLEYGGVSGLGQRTEIKNLSSFKAVEDAIVAERDRQISVLEAGGVIEGETRGWTLGSSETRRLRGKEGEVDYRYMPDPDLGVVRIGEDLIAYLTSTLPALPDELLTTLTQDPSHGLSPKDARTLIALDSGARLDYYLHVLSLVRAALPSTSREWTKASRAVANWTLMDLPAHLATVDNAPFPYAASATHGAITPPLLADIILHVLRGDITQVSARRLLTIIHATPPSEVQHLRSVAVLIDRNALRLVPLSDEEYIALAQAVLEANPDAAAKARIEAKGETKNRGKLMYCVGQMVRTGEQGRVQPERAEQVLAKILTT